MILHLKTLLVFILISLFVPTVALAAKYGEGGYGGGAYNVGPVTSSSSSSSSTTTTSTSSGDSCNDQKPGSRVPWLYGAIANDHKSVTLYFTPADEPVTKYILEYGLRSGDYVFGVQDIGLNSRAQMSYLVKGLAQSTKYYFRVRAQNGCATGEWSNEISSTTKGAFTLNSLAFTSSELNADSKTETNSESKCKPFTVQAGDTLWIIAKKLLGDGSKYQELIRINSEDYPSLKKSSNIKVGWKLRPPCDKPTELTSAEQAKNVFTLKVKVLDQKKNPVEGAEVTIHSTPITGKTGKDGLAVFEKVEAGEHKVQVAYNDYVGEQSLNLSGDTKIIDLNITIEPKKVLFSPTSIIIIVLLSIAFIVVLLLLRRNRK